MGILDRVNPFKVSPEAKAAQEAAKAEAQKAKMQAYKIELKRLTVEKAKKEAKQRAAWDVMTPQQKIAFRMQTGVGAMRGIAQSGMFGMQPIKTKRKKIPKPSPNGLF